jgi:hypothetical protein
MDGSSWKDGDKQEAVIGTQALSHTHHTNKQTNNKSLNETLDLKEDDFGLYGNH